MRRSAVVPVLAVLAAAGGGTAALAAPQATAARRHAVVKTGDTRLGRVLVDAHGMTLYVFARDERRRTHCRGYCAQVWPRLRTHAKPDGRHGAPDRRLGRTKSRPRQATYRGHPLYTYVGDSAPGQVNGQGLIQFGGKWTVVRVR